MAFGQAAGPRVSGHRHAQSRGEGFVDYVLWGDDGKPLGLVEAKRTKRDARVGQQQARLYADCLEQKFGQRPVIFYSNGYEHWIWDDRNYPPREVQGFYKKDELERLIQRRNTRLPLGAAEIDRKIVERYYQERAIRRIGEAFEKDHERKALVVMATGAGKTRTVVALCDLMMRCNWVKRVLFLADRIALVKQTTNVFKKFLPSASAVNVLERPDEIGDARVLVSTYPTMLRLIDETKDEKKIFGPGHFDLVIIDEAHRSVYQKYRAIFEYFDSFLIGLTATPKDEVDHNTYGLFDLEDGVPTDAYSLEEAVRDKFLVPPKAVSVPMKFQREGIKYRELTQEERDRWDEIEWDEDGTVPGSIEPEALNRWLFNEDTVDKVLEHLMTQGQKVAEGDRLGKTIIFAKNHAHAQFIADRFDKNYPHYRGEFARVIDFQVEYVQSLIDSFSNRLENAPHRHFRGHAGHRHRRSGGRQPGLLQDGALQNQVLADGGSRYAAAARPVRSRTGQEILLHLRLLPESRILQPEPGDHFWFGRRFAEQETICQSRGTDFRVGQARHQRRQANRTAKRSR